MSSFSVQNQKIGPAQVKEWRGPGPNGSALLVESINRKFRKRWANVLASQMIGGRFLPTTTIAIAHVDGDSYLVNGQHTLAAIEQSGVTLDLAVAHHKLDNHGELVSLYTKYDVGLKRSFSDALRAHNITTVLDLPSTDVNRLAAAVKKIARGIVAYNIKITDVDNEEWITPLVEWSNEFKLLKQLYKGGEPELCRLMMSSIPLSIALVTMRDSPKDAAAFWQRVAQDDGLKKGDPARMILRILREFSASPLVVNRGVVSTTEYAKLIAYYYNRGFNGQTAITLQVGAAIRNPMTLSGTRYADSMVPWSVGEDGSLVQFEPK